MLNFEKYKETIKGISINSFAMKDGKVKVCEKIPCRECDFHDENCSCGFKKTYWLYKEYQKNKIKISKATKTVLENLDDKYKWIAKDEAGELMIYEAKPHKKGHVWSIEADSNYSYIDDIFKKELFDFLSWEDEEPTNIEDVLENYEIVEEK